MQLHDEFANNSRNELVSNKRAPADRGVSYRYIYIYLMMILVLPLYLSWCALEAQIEVTQ